MSTTENNITEIMLNKYVELSTSQIKAYNKLKNKGVMNLFIENGRVEVNPHTHLGDIRGNDIIGYLKRELGIILGDGMNRASNFSTQAWVAMNKNNYVQLNPEYHKKLKEIHGAIESKAYSVRIPVFDISREIVEKRLKQEKEYVKSIKREKSEIIPTWGNDTPMSVGLYGLEKNLLESFGSLKTREKSLDKITTDIELLKLIDGNPTDEIYRKLDPKIDDRKESIEKRRKKINKDLEKVNDIMKTHEERFKDMPTATELMNENGKIECTDKDIEYVMQIMKEECPEAVHYIETGTINNVSPGRFKRLFTRKMQRELDKVKMPRHLIREKESYERDLKALNIEDPYSIAKEKYNQITKIKSKPIDVSAFIFPENGLRAQFCMPIGHGTVSKYISSEIDHMFPSDVKTEHTAISQVYLLDNDMAPENVKSGIDHLSDELTKIAGIKITPKLIDRSL